MIDLDSIKLPHKIKIILKQFRRFFGTLTEFTLLIVLASIAYIILLYLLKYLWFLYTSTLVGQAYAEYFSFSYRLTSEILSDDIIYLALYLTLLSTGICLAVGCVFKFFHLIRYIYSARGFFGRMIFFGLPLAYVVALYLRYVNDLGMMDTAFAISLFPTLFVLQGCFRVADEFIPEMMDLRYRKYTKASN